MIQDLEERRARADELLRQSSYSRGMVRAFIDQAEWLRTTYTPGSDPARTALDIAYDTLLGRAARVRKHADDLELRARFLMEITFDDAP